MLAKELRVRGSSGFISRSVLLIIWTLIAVAVGASLVIGAHKASPRTAQATLALRTTQVASVIRCPVCDGLSVQESSVPIARDLRALIQHDLKSGMSTSQVEDSLVARYGQSILLEPQRHGITLLVWLAPLAAALAGLLGLGFFLWRRGRKGGGRPGETDSGQEVPDELRRDIEREVAVMKVRGG